MDTLRQRSAVKHEGSELAQHAKRAVERCLELAKISDVPGETTRTFLSPATRIVMTRVQSWMEAAGLAVTTDAAGNLRGIYKTATNSAPRRLIIASHLDTVPNAGAFDGILGIMLGISLVEMLSGERLSYAIEVIAFSEEEGVRFRTPFIGSRALVGRANRKLLDIKDADGISIEDAIRAFGLDASSIEEAELDNSTEAYLEFHIEQGPVLESEGLSLGIVESIVGQTRGEIIFIGTANHAGTTPMNLRHDALAGIAEWIVETERLSLATKGLVSTIGRISAAPGAINVIAGEARASLDVRHASDTERIAALDKLITSARTIAAKRGLQAEWHQHMEQQSVAMDVRLTQLLETAMCDAGLVPLRMNSGAGHDAMIVAERIPTAMIFLRSPGGISHHPDESVREEDVANALAAGYEFLKLYDRTRDTHA